MLDPFVNGGLGGGEGGSAAGDRVCADKQASLPPDIALAYAHVLKAPPKTSDHAGRASARATVAATATDGDPVVRLERCPPRSTDGFAAGMDYRCSPGSVFVLALAGGDPR